MNESSAARVMPEAADSPPATRTAPSGNVAAAWSLPTRIAFRFYFVFAALYFAPFPLGDLPGTSFADKAVDKMWTAIVSAIARAVLHRSIGRYDDHSGSGDRTSNYVLMAFLLSVAAVATLVWSILDRRRLRYARLQQWLHVYVRFAVGLYMFSYGFSKVFHTQFPAPSPSKLEQPYGDASPMGLLWTFMGYSTAYNVFTGLAEVVGGALLVFRRTATLGALVVVAVMTNVVMLNFCYDVPVKLFSMTLLISAGYVATPRLHALFDVLVRGRATPAVPPAPLFTRRRLDLAARIFGVAFALYAAYDRGHTRWVRARDTATARTRPSPVSGQWDVEEFVRDGRIVPATLDEATRWRWVALSVGKKSGALAFRQVDDFYERLFFDLDKDPAKHTFVFDGPPSFQWQYTQPDADHLTLTGDYAGHSLAMRLRRRTARAHRLETRGFHWINEEPYNR